MAHKYGFIDATPSTPLTIVLIVVLVVLWLLVDWMLAN